MEPKVLHILRELNIGGIERSTITYSNELSKKGLWIGIYGNEGKLNHSNIVSQNVKLFFSRIPGSRSIIWFIKIYREIVKIIEDENINILHFHFRIHLPVIYLLKLFHKNISIVYTHHNCFKDFLNRFILADKIISLNSFTTSDLPTRLRDKIVEITHGVHIHEAQRLGNNRQIRNIGFVGRFAPSKGIPVLIYAYKQLLEMNPELGLILRGEGPDLEEINKLINDLGVSSHIKIQPPEILLENVYKDIDLLVVTSQSLEGFGLVSIEAMSYGIPVVSSDLDVFNEVNLTDKPALKFKRDSTDSLVDCLTRIFKDQDQLVELSKSSLEFVKNKYNIKFTLREYYEFYTSLLSQK